MAAPHLQVLRHELSTSPQLQTRLPFTTTESRAQALPEVQMLYTRVREDVLILILLRNTGSGAALLLLGLLMKRSTSLDGCGEIPHAWGHCPVSASVHKQRTQRKKVL